MTLESLLKLAQQYHPSAEITRLVRWGQRVVFYGGGADESQFAVDFGLEAPIVEPLKMAIAVRSNFVAELLSGYNSKFPLQMELSFFEDENQVETCLVSDVKAFEEFIAPFSVNNSIKRTKTSIELYVTKTPFPRWRGSLVSIIVLNRTFFEI